MIHPMGTTNVSDQLDSEKTVCKNVICFKTIMASHISSLKCCDAPHTTLTPLVHVDGGKKVTIRESTIISFLLRCLIKPIYITDARRKRVLGKGLFKFWRCICSMRPPSSNTWEENGGIQNKASV